MSFTEINSLTPFPGPGKYKVNLMHNSLKRSFHAILPASTFRSDHPPPLVIALHGGGGNSGNFDSNILLSAFAEKKGFVLLYPDGTGRLKMHTWNAGPGKCGYAADKNVDDVGFLVEVVQVVSQMVIIDRSRVYATGLSNGAMMVDRLADDERSAWVFAAIAGVAGCKSPTNFPSRLIPMLHIHSLTDPRAIYGGGEGPPFPMTKIRTIHDSVDHTLNTFAHHYGLRPTAPGPLVTNREGHTAQFLRWTDEHNQEIILWQLNGPGHVWPLNPVREYPILIRKVCGASSNVIDSNAVIWEFFERHRLAPLPPLPPH